MKIKIVRSHRCKKCEEVYQTISKTKKSSFCFECLYPKIYGSLSLPKNKVNYYKITNPKVKKFLELKEEKTDLGKKEIQEIRSQNKIFRCFDCKTIVGFKAQRCKECYYFKLKNPSVYAMGKRRKP